MMIFNQRPPAGYCDPNSELLKYYEKSNNEIREANRLYEYQNRVLRMKLATIETEKFYGGNLELLKVTKENKKLRKSIRKLYEKYIKPYKPVGMKLHTNGKPTTSHTYEIKDGMVYNNSQTWPGHILIHKGNV